MKSFRATRGTPYLFPDSLDRAVKGTEHPTPYSEVATQDRCSCFDGGQCADASLTEGGIPEAFHTMPQGAADSLQISTQISKL